VHAHRSAPEKRADEVNAALADLEIQRTEMGVKANARGCAAIHARTLRALGELSASWRLRVRAALPGRAWWGRQRPPPAPAQSSEGLSRGVIVGIVIAVIMLLRLLSDLSRH
jgi:hypothetical protein